jgi:hypothetical protein
MRHALILAALGGGGLLVAIGMLRLWSVDRRRDAGATAASEHTQVRPYHIAILVAILAGATVLRMHGLEQRSMCPTWSD